MQMTQKIRPTSAQFGPPRWEDVGFLVSAGFTQIADLNTSKKAHSHTGELFFFSDCMDLQSEP